MRGEIVAVVGIVALLLGTGVGYLYASSSQANATHLSSFGVSGESCNRMGSLLCGEELSFLVTNTTRFANMLNGSDFVFLKGQSSMQTSGYGASTTASFLLYYDRLGPLPPHSGCLNQTTIIAGQVFVTIPLVNGFFPVSNMSIIFYPTTCSALPSWKKGCPTIPPRLMVQIWQTP